MGENNRMDLKEIDISMRIWRYLVQEGDFWIELVNDPIDFV